MGQRKNRVLPNKYEKLFKTNQTRKGVDVDIQLKPNNWITQQKTRPTPVLLQEVAGEELEQLIASGHIGRAKCRKNDSFVSPAVSH